MPGKIEGSIDSDKLLEEIKDILLREGKEGVELAQKALDEDTSVIELKKALSFTRSCMREPTDYFRTALLSLCSKAVGGTAKSTFHIGASLNLFGRAIGIHDDIIDQSKMKEGKPTAPGKFGEDIALILSDILFFKGFTLFRGLLGSGISLDTSISILSVIEKIWFEQSEGEVLEVQHRGKTGVTPKECMRKIRMRASEMEACCRIGGILGGGSNEDIESLGNYGRMLGIASILRNELIDMLDLKTLRHRIQKESLPLPIIYALQDPSKKLESIISHKPSMADLRKISKFTEERNGLQYVSDLIDEAVRKGLSSIDRFKNKVVYQRLKLLVSSLPIRPEEWKPFFD